MQEQLQTTMNFQLLFFQAGVFRFQEFFFPPQTTKILKIATFLYLATKHLIIPYHILDLIQEKFNSRFWHYYHPRPHFSRFRVYEGR